MLRTPDLAPHASALAIVLALIGCGPQPATQTATAQTTATAPPPDAPADAKPAEPARTWQELYPDAPKTELDPTNRDEKLRKLSIDIEVTYRELAKVAQKAPSACPIDKSGCSDDWTRYLSELAAVKQRIDRPNTSCEGADASPERAHVLEHQAYQLRAYQSHVDKLAAEMGSADAKATFARMLQAAEKAHSTPPCVEPGQ